jgi:hypothetical protein
MRFAIFLLFLLLPVSGCSTRAPEPAPEPADDGPAAVKDWKADQVARITYDPKTSQFTLTNVSARVLWFDGEVSSREKAASVRPDAVYQRRLPGGDWVCIWCNECATLSRRGSLKPGQSLSLGTFPDLGPGGNAGEARAFVAKGGDLKVLPARVGIAVAPAEVGRSEIVHSEPVVVP